MEKYADPLELIQNKFKSLSKSQKKIAEFIINDYDRAAFMTAAILGKTVEVSESTVVRFANTLGYSGYKDFQKGLQRLIKNKLTTVQRLSMVNTDSNEESILRKVMKKDMENIEKAINEMDYENFQKAIELILNAKNIYVLGMRSSYYLSGYLGFYLSFLFDNVKVVISGANDVFEQLLNANHEDLIIGISYPRYSKRTLEALDYCKEKGCKIISITDSLISPASKDSDISLIAGSNMLSFVDSLVAPMSLINALMVAIGIKKKDDIKSSFESLEEIWNKYNVYNQNHKDN